MKKQKPDFVWQGNSGLNEIHVLRIMQRYLKPSRPFLLVLLAIIPFAGFSQMPTHVDPGFESDPVNLQENPEYIVLIVVLIAAMLLFYFRARRKKSSKQKDKNEEK